MKSLFRPGCAVALVSFVVVLNGCKETPQPAATKPATTGTTAPKTVATTAPSISTTTTASNGEPHDDLSPMGIPLYPNIVDSGWTDTEAIRPLVGKARLDTPRMRNGEMSTKDSFDVVYAWYLKRMPGGSEKAAAAAAASNHRNADGDRTALFEAGRDGDPGYQRVMILRGKTDEYTLVNL